MKLRGSEGESSLAERCICMHMRRRRGGYTFISSCVSVTLICRWLNHVGEKKLFLLLQHFVSRYPLNVINLFARDSVSSLLTLHRINEIYVCLCFMFACTNSSANVHCAEVKCISTVLCFPCTPVTREKRLLSRHSRQLCPLSLSRTCNP